MIFLGADHRGFELKEQVKVFLDERNLAYTDMGAYSSERSDYTEHAFAVANMVSESSAQGKKDMGIVVCGSGTGACIVANKVKGIRAALATNTFMAEHSRQHDDSNILVLAAQVVSADEAISIVKAFLDSDFDHEERHAKRIAQIDEYENTHWQSV